MVQDEGSTAPVLRLFEARAKPGCAAALAEKLTTTSVEVVRDAAGNKGHFSGRAIASDGELFLFASVWDDLSAVEARFGADWQSSFLPAGYAELIDDCSVRHFALTADWDPAG